MLGKGVPGDKQCNIPFLKKTVICTESLILCTENRVLFFEENSILKAV